MKKYFLILIVFCVSCIGQEKPPDNVIPKDTMARMFMDIHINEAKVSTRGLRPDSAHIYYEVYRRQLYSKYNIKPERFQESFEYYMRNLKEMDEIYEVVVDSLALKEGRGKLN